MTEGEERMHIFATSKFKTFKQFKPFKTFGTQELSERMERRVTRSHDQMFKLAK
jgi:hypothetical protein